MKKKLAKFVPIFLLITFIPLVVSAQVQGPCRAWGGLNAVLCKLSEIFRAVVPVLIALGVIYFVWGVITYVIADSEEAKKKGRDTIIFGIIGLAVIISVWGLVYLITATFGIDNPAPRNIQNLLPF